MNPNELMIGDWCINTFDDEVLCRKGDLVRVEDVARISDSLCIVGIWIVRRQDEGRIVVHVMCKDIEPIPITESFIQKNFQPRYKDIYELTTLWGIRPFHDHWQVCLLTMDEFGGGSWEGAFEVHYVHEVQQFLRLLKVEKEVEV